MGRVALLTRFYRERGTFAVSTSVLEPVAKLMPVTMMRLRNLNGTVTEEKGRESGDTSTPAKQARLKIPGSGTSRQPDGRDSRSADR
jgi:hypothetical protein